MNATTIKRMRTATRPAARGKLEVSEPSAADMQQHADEATALLKGIASSKRLLLLCQLVDDEHSVGELAETLGLSQSVVSQHLARLRHEGIVDGRREAQTIYYSLRDARVRAMMLKLFELFCSPAR